MAKRRALRFLLHLDTFLPVFLLLGFLIFFSFYLRRDPGLLLTTWATTAIIAMSTENFFTGIGDRVREWQRLRNISAQDLTRLANEGGEKFRALEAAASNEDGAWTTAQDLVEDIEELCEKMRPGIDRRLTSRSHLWSIAVYGLSSVVSFNLLDAWFPNFYALPWYLRGICFAPTIFIWEYTWGWAIEKLTGICPWRYRRSLARWKRYIRLEYAGFWFGFGFVLEWTHVHLVPLIVSTFSVLPHH